MNQLSPISSARLPQTYEAARTALAECNAVDECKDWADKAAALASYARQSQDDQLERMAQRIRARAIRRAGELLKQIEPRQGANQNIKAGDHPNVLTRTDAAREAGMSPHQAKQAVRVSNVPEDEIEARALEYEAMARGCVAHAKELRAYRRGRSASPVTHQWGAA